MLSSVLVAQAAAAATSVLAAPSLETVRSPSPIAASPTFAVGRSALKKRARSSGTAGAAQASEPRSDDMAADEGSISLGHDPSSMDSDSVDPQDGGTNLID